MSMMTTCRQIVHVRSFVRPRQFSFALLLVILVTFATNDEPYSQDREYTQRERERERGERERERERGRERDSKKGRMEREARLRVTYEEADRGAHLASPLVPTRDANSSAH
jgi:Ni/Co efflux regulator RcnB